LDFFRAVMRDESLPIAIRLAAAAAAAPFVHARLAPVVVIDLGPGERERVIEIRGGIPALSPAPFEPAPLRLAAETPTDGNA
jgi:hypothetical protein